ncbi:MAG: hypothetical protein Q4A71_06130 [Actinomycetaceae bacterium]|nr:hypothetical protein [Actinomycetaceae bacterium]
MRNWKIWAALVVVLVIIGGVFGYYQHHQTQAAQAAYMEASKEMASVLGDLSDAKSEGAALAGEAHDKADPGAIAELKEAVKVNVSRPAYVKSVSATAYRKATAEVESVIETAKAATKKIKEDIKKVQDSTKK